MADNSIKKQNHKTSKNTLMMIACGSQFTGMILAGFIVGYFFDSFFNTQPLFIIGCGFMGIVGGFMKLHELFK